MDQAKQKNNIIEAYCLLAVDILCIIISLYLANGIRHKTFHFPYGNNVYMVVLFALLLICVLYSSVVNHNRDFIKRGFLVEFLAIIKLNAVMIITVTFGLFFLKESESFSRVVLMFFVMINVVFMYAAHVVLKRNLRIYLLKYRSKVKVMVITQEEYASKIVGRLQRNTEYTYEITSAVIWDQNKMGQMLTGMDQEEKEVEVIPIVANKENLLEVAKQLPLDEVFLFIPDEKRKEIELLIQAFEEMGIICHYNIDVAGMDTKTRQVGEFAGYTVVTYAANYIDFKHHFIKRLMDITGGLLGLFITMILFPFVAIAIKLESKGPILFSQIRIGKNGRRFKIYKFRSMFMDAEERKKELQGQNEVEGLMFKMKEDPRITKVGKFIRKTSIDELPQFYNVLVGDMSLVGTRPPTVDEFEQYSGYYRRRLCMTPGLTGLWQVSGRNEIDNFDDVVKYDLHYIDYWSLSLDLKILCKTVSVVLFGKGAE